METSKGISYVIMPMEVLQNPDLTPMEKILYCYLTLFKKQCCFQSNTSIAEAVGADPRTVSRGISKLESTGYVFVEFVNGDSSKRRVYVLLDNPDKIKYLAKKGAFDKKAEAKAPTEQAQKPQGARRVLKPYRGNYGSDEEYEKALYAWNSMSVSV